MDFSSLALGGGAAFAPMTMLGTALQTGGQLGTDLVNINQARINRQFQLDMSSTAYQRAVADMRAAGINPMLAAGNGGASTGSGAMARVDNPVPDVAATALQLQRVQNESKLADAEVERKQAETDNLRSTKPNIEAGLGEINARTLNLINSAAKVDAETPGARAYSTLVSQLGSFASSFVKGVQAFVKNQQSGSIGDALYKYLHDDVPQALQRAASSSPPGQLLEQLDKAGKWLQGKMRSWASTTAKNTETMETSTQSP